MLCVLMKIFPHASAKKKRETVKGFKFCAFTGRVEMTGEGRWGGDCGKERKFEAWGCKIVCVCVCVCVCVKYDYRYRD